MRNKFILLCTTILTSTLFLLSACQHDNTEEQSVEYGYVAFRLVKESSLEAETKTRARLNWLSDAHKVTVTMQSEDLTTLKQTLPITYYDKELAEWGVTSDKLRMLAGSYKVLGYKLYDNIDNELLDAQCEGVEFEVVKGGLSVCDIAVEEAVERGKVAFRLVKHFWEETRAGGDYLFESIKAVDVTVKHAFTGKLTTLEARELQLVEEFVEGAKDESLYNRNALTAYIECAESFWLEAGDYTITSYTTYSDAKAKYVLETASIADLNKKFSVEDNQLNVVEQVPILLSTTAEHINDYIALKEIWLALDGENWSFYGEEYPAGSNWDFNKDIDMWGDQPGVTLNAEGRVENLNLSGFGAKGVVPDAIGQLTDLKLLYLGNHNELIGGYDSSESIDSRNYYRRVLQRDAREGLSLELKSVINRDATQRPILSSRIDRKDVAFGNLTNGITGISRAMMRLTKLEQFFIANAPITTEGFFVGEKEESWSWENFTNLMDVEIYNCPNITALPRELITELPNIQSLNVAMNYGISGEQLKADWEALIDGNSGDKVQILYIGYNNLQETPSYDYLKRMSKIGLLDCNSNKLRIVHPFGKEVCPTTLIYDYNQIENIYPAEDGYFCGLNQLEDLTCSNNKLTKLPDLFSAKSVYSMISLDFSSNDISELENGEQWRGVNTSTLNLADNKFVELPKRLIGSGSKIETLMLSSNGMRKIEAGALKGAGSEYLTTIDLSFNRLTEIPYEDFSITNIPFLYGIDLSSNALSAFPYAPLSIDRLTVISIRQQRDDEGNRTLSEWPEGIGNHKGLAALYIGSNNLGKINDTISPYILLFEIKDNPNISIDLSNVCPYIEMGYYELIYDSTQDIRGCDALNLD
ncbi:MAG: DUF4458 domain-containing protein [Alistipes sp.]|nr:DUF4458 domain-containing protein [Alistipes sp.]